MRPVGGQDKDRFAGGGEEVAEVVELKAVRPSQSRPPGHVQQHPPLTKYPVGLDRVGQPGGSVRVTVGQVEPVFIRRERNAIRCPQVVEQQGEIPLRRRP